MTLIGLLLLFWSGVTPASSSVQVASAQEMVTVRVAIVAEEPNFSLVATTGVKPGTRALAMLKEMVQLEAVDYGGNRGVFVTGLCGIKAPSNRYWALYIDEKMAKTGISQITITQPTKIEWRLIQR